jgi:D-alanyl-D-alanine carboxypeptidase
MKRTVLFLLAVWFILQINVSYAHGKEKDFPEIQSETAVLIAAKSNQVLYDKNKDVKMYPASLTKVATAIVAIEEGNINDIVTVSENARNVDGTRVYLEPGEKVTMEKLIQGMLINSGNDAAVAIAEHMDGSVEKFCERMNRFIKKNIGVHNTHFTNPHGLFDPEHQTTAYDMAVITSYALNNAKFREIFATKELKWKGESWKTTIYNHHQMLRDIPYDGVIGGKTGYVSKSGHTLITAAERDGITLIAVVLKSGSKKNSYRDTIKLLDYGFEHYRTTKISSHQIFKDADHHIYHPSEPIYYTHKIGEPVKMKVNKEGVLVIRGDGGKILAVKALTKQDVKNEDQKKSEKEAEWSYFSDWNLYLYLAIAFILVIVTMIVIILRKGKVRHKNPLNRYE